MRIDSTRAVGHAGTAAEPGCSRVLPPLARVKHLHLGSCISIIIIILYDYVCMPFHHARARGICHSSSS